MAKPVVTFEEGSSETDEVVRRWMLRENIDPSKVSGYRITRHMGRTPTIELVMFFDDHFPQEEGGQ
jgi:hypothetical protein